MATTAEPRTLPDGSATRPASNGVTERVARRVEDASTASTGLSLFNMLTLGSIGASIALFLSGKREEGIFVGLWAPTFQALKSAIGR